MRDLLEALSISEARYRTVLEQSNDAIFLLDLAGRVVSSNARLASFCGCSMDALIGAPFVSLLIEESVPRAERALSLALEGSPQTWQAGVRQVDGTIARLVIKSTVLSQVGRVAGTVNFAQDVTARERAEAVLLEREARLRQAQKMEAVGQLAGGVAHDFNNLLTVILGCSDALKRRVVDGLEVNLEDIEEIRAAAQRARDLTRQLLAFARKQVIKPVFLDLNAVVQMSETLLRRVIGENVFLNAKLAPAPATVRADPGQMEQVLVNLAVNARDAMPNGGVLVLETRLPEATSTSPAADTHGCDGRWVQLRISDSGTGISPEVQAHLFEPFFTTKGPGEGTGLGLATVYGIIEQSGGHIHVTSSPGAGACFEICLPWVANEPRRSKTSLTPEQVGGTETILFVEDDLSVQRVTARALSGAGYQVIVAKDGAEALDMVAKNDPIHLVLTDVVMPGMSGRALADELRRRAPNLPILFISGYPQGAIGQQGVIDDRLDFLPKPFDAPTLLARVREILDAGANSGPDEADH